MERQHLDRARRATLASLAIAVLVGCGAGSSDDTSSNASAVTAGSAACDKTPIDRNGTLPACAAGSASRAKAGVPDDYTGPVKGSLSPTATELAAGAIAAQKQAEQHPANVDPVELGYPPIPAGARVAPNGAGK